MAIEYDLSCDASCAYNEIDGGLTGTKINYCVNGNCGVPINHCSNATVTTTDSGVSNTTDTSYNCDLKTYIAWQGTDATGAYCSSGGARQSQFVLFGINSAYAAAATSETFTFVYLLFLCLY